MGLVSGFENTPDLRQNRVGGYEYGTAHLRRDMTHDCHFMCDFLSHQGLPEGFWPLCFGPEVIFLGDKADRRDSTSMSLMVAFDPGSWTVCFGRRLGARGSPTK